ncbi:MAG TPA: hypothetical protein VFF69_02735 [Phycisphaerales bacterium]|nr:hypothetical protein [Phycisphaerales bacterium]
MHPSSNAFDRVKSLLGKLDRSIEDARRRRLTDGDEPDPEIEGPAAETQTKSDQSVGLNALDAKPEPTRAEAPSRTTSSKYGRARPIRDLSGPGQPSWQRA